MNLLISAKKYVLHELTERQSKMDLKRKISKVEKVIRLRGGSKSLKEIFHDIDDELWLWILAEGYKFIPGLTSILPSMPPEHIQRKFTGSVGFGEAFQVYKLFKNIARVYGKDFGSATKVMDFGCGWGRYIRLFLKDVSADQLYGIDVDKEIINLCKSTSIPCNLLVGNPLPPTEVDDNTFDIIYAYSVFSHLSESAHLKWLEEFKRVLKPDGILIATTWGRDFLLYIDGLRKIDNIKAIPPHLGHVQFKSAEWEEYISSFGDIHQAINSYNEGVFCFSGNGYNKDNNSALDNSFYGEACIPKQYVYKEWSRYFKDVDFIHSYIHNATSQNVIVAQK